MKLPSILLGATLLFWGWQTGLWMWAVPMALLLAGQHLIQSRWDFSARDFRRIFYLCLLIGSLALIYILLSQRSPYFIYALLQWLPMAGWLLVAAQAYSTGDRVNLSALFANPSGSKLSSLDLNLPYFTICLLSASAAKTGGFGFYVGMVGLVAWALWSVRSRRYSPILWLSTLLMAGGIGLVGHLGLHQLHVTIEQQSVAWLSQFTSQAVNPLQTNTRIGDIGQVKLSNGIVFRVSASDHQQFPILLRQTTYNKYQSPTWVAFQSQFRPIQPDGSTWRLGEEAANPAQIKISAEKAQGFLTLPDGTFQINSLPVAKLEKNQYGTVKVEGEPGAIAYDVLFKQGRSFDRPPTEADLQVPEAEKPAIAQTLQQLSLEGMSSQAILHRVSSFFQRDFKYSLNLTGTTDRSTPIANFLLKSRTGHCEYFAAATTLLLRQAGIPARYAIGYSVHEFSPLEGQYIVRGRHAHAWSMVYLNHTWQSFDTTPADWVSFEDATAPAWQIVADGWSFVMFKLSTGLSQFGNKQAFQVVGWAIAPLLMFVLWKFARKQRRRRFAVKTLSSAAIAQPAKAGIDSEFYSIEQALSEVGLNRHPSEALSVWMQRLQAELPATQLDHLRSILELHYRYRFDPNGMEVSDRAKLTSLCHQWLEEYRQLINLPHNQAK